MGAKSSKSRRPHIEEEPSSSLSVVTMPDIVVHCEGEAENDHHNSVHISPSSKRSLLKRLSLKVPARNSNTHRSNLQLRTVRLGSTAESGGEHSGNTSCTSQATTPTPSSAQPIDAVERVQQLIRAFPFKRFTMATDVPKARAEEKTVIDRAPYKRTNSLRFMGRGHGARWNAKRKAKSRDDLAISKAEGSGTVWQLLQQSTNTMCMHGPTAWLAEQLRRFVQLSGHEGTIIPATDRTLFKCITTDSTEIEAYKALMVDSYAEFVPKFYRNYDHNDQRFIEIENLTFNFCRPALMDIKIGCRTFLESEVVNPKLRGDLYDKMVALDPRAPTEEENEGRAITKLRYMQFRENNSSSSSLAFRIEAMKLPSDEKTRSCFKRVHTMTQVCEVLSDFVDRCSTKERRRMRIGSIIKRLKNLADAVTTSHFFATHEVIGSSLLFTYAGDEVGVWAIDFAKALPIEGEPLDHVSPWKPGNHEDGYLMGVLNLVKSFEQLLAEEECLSPRG